jgi:hypothetical protein
MDSFESEDYLFLTHLGGYTESIINEEDVENLTELFPGKTFLVNETPQENEDFENKVHGEHTANTFILETLSGLGEPEDVPEPVPDTVYFGGFRVDFCMANTAERIHQEHGEEPSYAVIADYTIGNNQSTLETQLESHQCVETIEELKEYGYGEAVIDQYPDDCEIVYLEELQ